MRTRSWSSDDHLYIEKNVTAAALGGANGEVQAHAQAPLAHPKVLKETVPVARRNRINQVGPSRQHFRVTPGCAQRRRTLEQKRTAHDAMLFFADVQPQTERAMPVSFAHDVLDERPRLYRAHVGAGGKRIKASAALE